MRFALVALAVLAQADDVQRYLTAASRLYENLEYERALEQLDRAKKLSRGIEDDVTVALYEGAIRADMGQDEQARAAFKTGLYLRPDAKLPVKVSPKVEQQFEDVRVAVKKELAPILARQQQEEAQRRAAEAKRKATDAPLKTDSTQVIVATSEPETPAVELVEKPGVEKRTPALPFIILGSGAVLGGAGAFLGMQSVGEVKAAHEATWDVEMRQHQSTAAGQATAANVLFGVAGAAAIAGAIAFFTAE
jgi:tetratricopeptide (TPR) repeat protein